MKAKVLLSKLEGVQTIRSVMSLLNVGRQKAIYCIHRLRKAGYVKTKKLSDHTRVYTVSFENKLKGVSYYEIINQNSPVKISPSKQYYVYGKNPSIEETLIFAIKTKNLRTVLAALSLFKKVSDWQELYNVSKENHLERQVGALYDLSRKIMRTRKMPDNLRTKSLPLPEHGYCYVVPGFGSDHFSDIEKVWKVYLPFNKEDLEEYK